MRNIHLYLTKVKELVLLVQDTIRQSEDTLKRLLVTRKTDMGQLVSAFLGEREGVHEAETLESLRILQKLVAAKLEAYAQKMEAEAFEDKSLPIIAVVDKTEKYLVKVENAPAEEIKKTLDDLFEGEFLDGLHNLVSTALNELLGNTSAGEKEKRAFHVVYANSTLLRVDYHMYKYDFSSKGLRDKMQNALCYVVHIAVLDPSSQS